MRICLTQRYAEDPQKATGRPLARPLRTAPAQHWDTGQTGRPPGAPARGAAPGRHRCRAKAVAARRSRHWPKRSIGIGIDIGSMPSIRARQCSALAAWHWPIAAIGSALGVWLRHSGAQTGPANRPMLGLLVIIPPARQQPNVADAASCPARLADGLAGHPHPVLVPALPLYVRCGALTPPPPSTRQRPQARPGFLARNSAKIPGRLAACSLALGTCG